MVKRTLILLAALALLTAVPIDSQAQSGQRIAFVDMDKVFNEYHRTKEFDARLQELADDVKAENDELVAEFEKIGEDLNKLREEISDPTLSDEARKRKRAESEEKLIQLRELREEIKAFQEERAKELQNQERRMRERVVKKITGVIDDYAAENDLFAVIDSSGNTLNQLPVIIFSDIRADITDDIIELINAGADLEEEEEDDADDAEASEEEN